MTTKKIDCITRTTNEFLHDLSDNETICFEILPEKHASSPLACGMSELDAAKLAIQIDRYNENNPPAKIHYEIEFFNRTEKREDVLSNDIRQKIKILFRPLRMRLTAPENGDVMLTNDQFKTLFLVTKPFFRDPSSAQEIVSFLYDQMIKRNSKK